MSSASGARLALANPLNRVTVSLDRQGTVTPDGAQRQELVSVTVKLG